ncbi:hypothetical protein PISL3812_08722 [Talaromyces islandicus]|uniref:Uncharacterized protein n=1 Tax=Talaromyces islandicus TaxID=28573 RepID=A0A0U1M8H6_TALIS|nr:hypothetical protein PISL3812_08722 [Talaromyces islandicus]
MCHVIDASSWGVLSVAGGGDTGDRGRKGRQDCSAQETSISTDDSGSGVDQTAFQQLERRTEAWVSHCLQLQTCIQGQPGRRVSYLLLTQCQPGLGWKQLKKGEFATVQCQAQSVSPIPSLS